MEDPGDVPRVELNFELSEYAARIAKTRAAMAARGVELLIASDPSNMAWLTGYDGRSFYVHRCVLLALDGEPAWYGRGQDANGAKRTVFMAKDQIIGYPDHYVQSSERHPVDRTGRAPVEYRARLDGIVAGRHFPGLAEGGDCLAVVAVPQA